MKGEDTTMNDEAESELAYLNAIVELMTDAPDRAKSALRLVDPAALTTEGGRPLYDLVASASRSFESPRQADLLTLPEWQDAKVAYIDAHLRGTDMGSHGVGVERYARAVMVNHRRRMVGAAADDLRSVLMEASSSKSSIESAARAALEAATSVDVPDEAKYKTLLDAVDEWMKGDSTPRVPTGFAPLDRVTGGGLPIGGLCVFAGPPSVGKSALALQAVLGALVEDESLHAVWGMGEMTMEAFARRAICNWSNRGLTPVTMSSAERRTDVAHGAGVNLAHAVGGRLSVVHPPMTVDRLEEAVVASKARLLVVDYVQLVEVDGAADRRAEVDAVVSRLRRLTLENNVAVVAVSNVSKAVSGETRIGAIGKESSELDYACDVMLLGEREPDDENGLRRVRWFCKKNRHGDCQDIETIFDGPLQTFSDAIAAPYDEFRTEAW
jgi:replicative DNA helicase